MPNYRRAFAPGASWFFTVNLLQRRRNDLLLRHVELLRDAVRRVHRDYPFTIDAWVVLPEHMHCVWTLPPGDADYPLRWRLIKTFFCRGLRIPRHPATQSALIWPGIPRPSGHLFHGHPAGQSERSDAGVALLV